MPPFASIPSSPLPSPHAASAANIFTNATKPYRIATKRFASTPRFIGLIHVAASGARRCRSWVGGPLLAIVLNGVVLRGHLVHFGVLAVGDLPALRPIHQHVCEPVSGLRPDPAVGRREAVERLRGHGDGHAGGDRPSLDGVRAIRVVLE